MDKIINVAILGAGNIARAMATALAGIKDEVRLYAVASRSYDKAKAFAEKWGFDKAYGSYGELAKDEAVDLIYVATPHSEHFANTMLCLENGRNCLVEKAFCGNKVQAEKLIETARAKKLLLAEAMWTRYQPSRKVINNIIADGKIGKVSYVESDFSVPIPGVERMVNPALAGGALLDLGVYSLTVPAMFVGTDVLKVREEIIKAETGVDKTTTVYLTYKNGVIAKAKCSFVDSESNYAKIVGDKGYMVFGPINVPEKIEIFDNEGVLAETVIPEIRVNGYEYQVLECKQAILAGKTEPVSMPHSETLKIMGWMDSIRAHGGVIYPFETIEDITLDDEDVWGTKDAFEA